MSKRFREYVWITRGFYVIRLVAALLVSLVYIILAATIQYIFVDFFGENTFNYIVGGLLSLFLGIIFCHYVGALLFMLVKGWHVAALAYIPKLKRADASAVEVGIRAFNKNLISFGAVYAVRTIMNNLLSGFKDRLWELFGDNSLAQMFMSVSTNPIVEHIAGDILHYGFDATIFYLVRHPGEDINDVPNRVLDAVKTYLYCLPSIMFTSIKSFLFFRFIPKCLKFLIILWVFLTQGVVAGILITVLMYPFFYILDNAFFDPLTMSMFIAAYSKKCDKPIDPNDPVVVTVNSILEEAENIDSVQDEDVEVKPTRKRKKTPPEAEEVRTTVESEAELFGETEQPVETPASVEEILESSEGIPDELVDSGEEIQVEEEEPAPPPSPTQSLINLARGGGLGALRNWSSEGLDDDPLQGQTQPDSDEDTGI